MQRTMDFALATGGVARLEPTCLVVFLDETGEEHLRQPRYPIFGIGGCATLVSDYTQQIAAPWRALKSAHFGGQDAELHASNLREPAPKQLSAIGDFFRQHQFFRVACVVTDRTQLLATLPPYGHVAYGLLKRLEHVARQVFFTRLALVFEKSDRGDRLAQKWLSRIQLTVREGGTIQPIPVEGYFAPKALREPGVEVADFVVQAAGAHARRTLRGNKRPPGRDVDAVFRDVDQRLVSVMLIESITWTPASDSKAKGE